MEPSDANCWFTDFDMNFSYSSFLQGIERFDELSQSSVLPDFSPISPDQCSLSNSNSEPSEPNPIPESTDIPDAVADHQSKTKRKPRGKKWNAGLKREQKGKIVELDGTRNEPSSSRTGRKRSYNDTNTTTDHASVETSESRSAKAARKEDQQEGNKGSGHLMAERKRREKLTQRFIALSSLLPDLTRMDKASVLEDAAKYVKQLQARVNELEAQGTRRRADGAILIAKPQSLTNESNSSICDDSLLGRDDNRFSSKTPSTKSLPPEIDVRFCGHEVLVKIHSEIQKGVTAKALHAIESLGLYVSSTSAVPFANSFLDITITAKIDSELPTTAEDLVKRIHFYIQ